MAVDKLVDSTQLDADLTSVADAIRAKSGGTGSLAFPAGFVTEIGNISGGGGRTPMDWLGAGTELYATLPDFALALEDTDYATWTPSTTSKQIAPAQTLGTFSAADLDRYDYIVRLRSDFQPVRIAGAQTKNTVERLMQIVIGSVFRFCSTISAVQSKTPGTNQPSSSILSSMPVGIVYYNSSGVLTYGTSQYGVYQYSNPSFATSGSGTTMTVTVKTSAIYARCNSTYFATDRAAELDQAESKIKFSAEIYRAERCTLMSGARMDLVDLYHNPL